MNPQIVPTSQPFSWAAVVKKNTQVVDEPDRPNPGSKEQKPARPVASDPPKKQGTSQPAAPGPKPALLRVRPQPPPAQKAPVVSASEKAIPSHVVTEAAPPSSVTSTVPDAASSVSGTGTSDASPRASDRDLHTGPAEGSAPNSKANTPRFKEVGRLL